MLLLMYVTTPTLFMKFQWSKWFWSYYNYQFQTHDHDVLSGHWVIKFSCWCLPFRLPCIKILTVLILCLVISVLVHHNNNQDRNFHPYDPLINYHSYIAWIHVYSLPSHVAPSRTFVTTLLGHVNHVHVRQAGHVAAWLSHVCQ